MVSALIFDFDGLILDTEMPLYEAWKMTFEHHGVTPITLEEWSQSLGLADGDPAMIDPVQRLRDAVGKDLDLDQARKFRVQIRNEKLDAMEVRPGVEQLLEQAQRRQIPVGIASSSPISWIEQHLGPRGLLAHFGVLSCAGAQLPGKPDPATYLNACAGLGVAPEESVALEDSPNGTTAAKAAGLYCIAVPAGVSLNLDFSHADHTVPTLEHVNLDNLPRWPHPHGN